MKKIFKTVLSIAAVAMTLASCNKEVAQDVNPEGKVVYFGTEVNDFTRASLTPNDGDTSFEAAWESDDALKVSCLNGDTFVGNFDATWNGTAFASTNAYLDVERNFVAVYPACDGEGVIPFGSSRVQNGNAYNGCYDVMLSQKKSMTLTAGETFLFNMNRQTAIAYFHFTSSTLSSDEKVISAKLSVNESTLAGSFLYDEGEIVSFGTSNSITLTFEDAPSINDLKLWFNILPGSYTGLKLEVETDNHTLTINNNSVTYEQGKLYKVAGDATSKWVAKSTPKPLYKKITSATEIEDGTYVICGALNSDKTTLYYLENTNKTKPSFVTFDGEHISIASDNSTIDVVDATDATWTIEEVDGGFSITSTAGSYALATTTGNDGLTTQSTYVGKPWTIAKDDTYNWSFKYNETSRYLVLYSLTNPRTYTSNSTNASGVFFLYKLDDPRETLATPTNLATEGMVLSWDAVEHADSYEVTVGSADAVVVATNSYTLEGLADYYSVSVVAVSENTEKYKTSKPATATDLKFGTPTLVTPTLAEGTVTENSITVTWSVDKRATAGYDCDIYDGETKLDKSKNVSTGSISFTGLTDGKTYTVKVQAKAVTGAKAYVASEVASVSVATKAAAHIGDITSEGTYTVMNATVMAVVNTSSFIAGDETGAILVYRSSHGCAVGNIVDIAGTVTTYEGVLEYSSPTISNKRTGSAPSYPTPVEANSAFVNGYSSNAITAYVHGIGTLSNSAKTITIGSKVLSLVAVPSPAVADGEVEFTGYVYGVKNGNIKACTLTCQVYVDPTAPTLSISPNPATKTWASGATDTYTVNVTTTNGGWTISPATLTWANVVEDHTANTIEITPNGANTTAADYTATITVKHVANPSLTKTITLKQQKAGGKVKDNDAKYTLTPSAGSNNSYTGNCDVTVGDITWNITGNAQQVPWRIGGKSISSVDRTVYSKTAYSKELWKISLTVGAASNITVNSLKLVYSTNANFSNSQEISGTFKASSTIDFEAEFPANCYYKFVFNVTVSGSSNKFVEFSKVEFFGYQE